MSGRRFFSFLAQSLDNRSADAIWVRGRLLDADNPRSRERIDIVDATTYLSSRGKQIRLDEGASRAFALDDRVMFEIASSDRDVSGRMSPIVCVGSSYEPDPDIWPDVLSDELVEFADAIGRSVSARQLSDIQRLADKLFSPSSSGVVPLLGKTIAAITGHRVTGGRHRHLPTAAERRRVVVVLDALDWRIQDARGGLQSMLTDPEVAILLLPRGVPNWSGLEQSLKNQGLLRTRAVLVQDPYEQDRYFDAAKSDVEIARSKLHAYFDICQLLGARKVAARWVASSTVQQRRGTRVQGSGDATAITGVPGSQIAVERQVNDDHERGLAQELAIEHEYRRSPVDVAAAERRLQEGSLEQERDLRQLVSAVKAGRGHTQVKIVLSTRDLTTAALDRVRRLEVPLVRLKALAGNYEAAYSAQTLEVTIDFWEQTTLTDDGSHE